MSKKISHFEIEALLKKEGFSILEPFKKLNTLHLICCPHGHAVNVNIKDFIRNKKCPECERLKVEKYVHEKMSPEGYFLLEPIKKLGDVHLMVCPKKHETKAILSNFLNNGARCKVCVRERLSKTFRTPYEDIVELSRTKGVILLTDKVFYEQNHHKKLKIQFTCKCGKAIKKSVGSFKKWTSCFNCAKNQMGRDLISFDFIKKTVELKGYSLISDKYLGNKEKLEIECKVHGIWKTRWNDIDQGHWCRKCSCGSGSKPQREIVEFIKSIYKGTLIQDDRIVLNKLELDIWLPEIELGIEHDGLYWHSEKMKPKILAVNKEKIKRVQAAGITFLAFYGDEWQNKRPIVESIIKNKIGAITNKIYARKTSFVEITNKEAKSFLEANHLDGYVKSTRSFGLMHNGQLVMCMTFRKTMRGENEIARMATLIDHVVVGGASKLLAHAPKPLVTYSNNRISNGDVYSDLGFEEITETFEFSYYYTDFKKRIFRTKCMKIADFPGTEREQAINGAFSKHFGHDGSVYRIYDYGHRKWLKNT